MKLEFSNTLEKEDLKAYMKLSAEQKLQWLEDIIDFNEEVLTEKKKKIQKMFLEEERNYPKFDLSQDNWQIIIELLLKYINKR